MRRLIVSNLMSLDGFVSGPQGELDWFVTTGFPMNTEFGPFAKELIRRAGGILMGRRTYEEFVSYWPTASGNDPVITEKMNTLPKFVFSRTLKSAPWGSWNTTALLNGDAPSEVRRLKSEAGGDLVIYGSAELVSALMKEGLVDELQIFVQPWILGNGRPEFKGLDRRYALTLVNVLQFKSGAVGLFYVPKV